MTCKGKQDTVAMKLDFFSKDQEFIYILGTSWPRCTNLFNNFSEIVKTSWQNDFKSLNLITGPVLIVIFFIEHIFVLSSVTVFFYIFFSRLF